MKGNDMKRIAVYPDTYEKLLPYYAQVNSTYLWTFNEFIYDINSTFRL